MQVIKVSVSVISVGLHSAKTSSNNILYYSFKIFPCFWLVKTTHIIHHNQLLLTKFGKNFVILNQWPQNDVKSAPFCRLFNPKTRSYLSHKSIPQGLSVCQTPNHVTITFPIFCRVPVPGSYIPCHFQSFERNEFGPFFQYSNVHVLKSRLSKQSFQWHQLELHKSQFYNSCAESLSRVFEWTWWMKGYINYVKLTNGKFNNSNAPEKVALRYK